MSYRVGMGPRMAKMLGENMSIGWDVPRIICDGCAAIRKVEKPNGQPYSWFLNNHPPPLWVKIESIDAPRQDYCPKCKVHHAP